MQTYSHSGSVSAGGAAATAMLGAAVAAVGGIIYAYAFYWIPFVYINFLIAIAFAMAMGMAVCVQARRAKIRNNLFVRVMAIAVALFGLYVYWAAYCWALAGIGNVGWWAFWPPTLASFGQLLFENGSWGIKGGVVKGWVLVGFWVAEAAMVLWFTVSAALGDALRPFCESCNEWTEIEPGVARLTASGDEPTWQQVMAGDLDALAEFLPASPTAAQFFRLDVARCQRCEQSRFLSLAAINITVDKKGKTSEKERQLITNAVC
jgi:hypothetical protein